MEKILSIVMTVIFIISIVPCVCLGLNATAEADEYYVYEIKDGEASIIAANESISGNITIPDTLGGYTVTSIDDYAFSSCCGITSIVIPDSINSIGSQAFFDCENLVSINVNTNNSNYISIDGVLFNSTATTIVKYPAGKKDMSYIIPNDTVCIGDEAFYGCCISSIIIPDSVTYIGDNAFFNCYNLTDITISKNVMYVGECAFDSCYDLESINVANENNTFCSIDGVLFNKDCTKLICYPCGKTSAVYTVPDNVNIIGLYAFSSCYTLEKVKLGNDVTNIGECAFAYCKGLKSIYIPSGVVYIGEEAFFECSSLAAIDVDEDNAYFSSIDGVLFDKEYKKLVLYPCGKQDVSYTIPNSVTAINNCAFECCNNLKYVTLSDNVVTIGEFAFYFSENIESITIKSEVTNIGDNAFFCCYNLTVFCYSDSFVIQYCIDNQIPYKVIKKNDILGDVNCDMVINNKDLALLMQHINSWGVEISLDAADVNLDYKVNNKDYVILMRYINGWSLEL